MAIIQVWTAPKAQSGAECIGVISHVIAGRVQEAGSTQNTVRLTVEKAVADAAGVSVGRWLWISHPWRGVTEWAVLQVNRADGRSRDTVEIIAGSLRQALALRGTIRTVNAVGPITTTFAAQSLPVASLLSLYFFTNQAADGLEWISPGVVAYQGAIKVGPITNWTRAQLLDEIEKATGYAFEFVRSGDVGYRLDLVRTRGDSAETVLLDAALNLNELAEAADLLASPTVIEPRTSSGLPMGETWWTVGSISGSGPFWVTLRDPANGPAVIREDDQVNGWYLRANDGVPVEITDSRASDSAVEVASVEGLLVGGLATLWASEDGALSPEITSPSGVAARGRAVQSISVSINSTDANRITDPTLRNALGLWEVRNPTAGGADVFGRNDPKTIPLVINGAVSGGATSITVDGGHPDSVDAVLRFGDAIAVDGVSVNSTANVVPSATGGATVAISPTLPSTIADAVQLAWTRGDAVIGTVVTSGVQSSGAASLVLTGLPAQPQVTAGDQFVLSGQVSATLAPGSPNPLPASITSGTAVQILELRLQQIGILPIVLPVYYSTTVTSTAAPGAAVNVDLSAAPPLPSGATVLFRTFTVTQTQTVRTYTITGTPAAWSGTGTGTFNISGTIGTSIANGTQLAWLRSGARLGFVKLTAARVTADTTLPLALQTFNQRVLSGDTFTLPAQTLYCGANMTLSGTGTGTIPLRVAAAGIADNTPCAVQRCRDFVDDELGSDIVLRLRGGTSTLPATYLSGSEFQLYSPVMRFESPVSPSHIFARLGLTAWAPSASQSVSLFVCFWDVDTQERLAVFSLSRNPITFAQTFEVEQHGGYSLSDSRYAIDATRRIRVSLHPNGGQVGNSPGGFLFLRFVAAGLVDNNVLVPALGTDLLPFVVDGGASNALWHRGQDVIETASNSTRYRATLNGAPQDGTAPLVFGGKVRVRSDALGTDRTLRITRLDWSLEDDGDVALELGALTPRLSES